MFRSIYINHKLVYILTKNSNNYGKSSINRNWCDFDEYDDMIAIGVITMDEGEDTLKFKSLIEYNFGHFLKDKELYFSICYILECMFSADCFVKEATLTDECLKAAEFLCAEILTCDYFRYNHVDFNKYLVSCNGDIYVSENIKPEYMNIVLEHVVLYITNRKTNLL